MPTDDQQKEIQDKQRIKPALLHEYRISNIPHQAQANEQRVPTSESKEARTNEKQDDKEE